MSDDDASDDDLKLSDDDEEEEEELEDERVVKLKELEAFADTLKLQLRIWDATNLEKVDQWGGRNDVYCVIFDGQNEEIGRTDVIRETLAPSWDAAVYELSVPLDLDALEIRIEVWNEDPGKDVFLGSTVILSAKLLDLEFEKKDFRLEAQAGMEDNHVGGAIGVSRVNLEKLDLQIWGASGLKQADAFGGANDVYCTVKIGDRELFKSPVVHDSLDPSWEGALCGTLLPANTEAVVLVEMWAHEETGEDDFLGVVTLDIAAISAAENRQLLPAKYDLVKKEKLSKRKQKFVGGKVEFSAMLTGQTGMDAPPDLRTQVQELEQMMNATRQLRRLAIRIDGLSNLPMTDVGDKESGVEPDTYCQVYWNDRHMLRTTTKVDMKAPTWSWEMFEVELPVYFQAANLRVEVWDHDKDKDDFLGEVILSAEQLLGLGLNARKDLDLQKKAADKKKFKKGQIIQGSLGISVVEVVRMQLQIMGCKGLANTDEAENALIAKPDTYCTLTQDDKQSVRTVMIANENDPQYPHEVFEILLPSTASGVACESEWLIEVWDSDEGKEAKGKGKHDGTDDFLGQVTVDCKALKDLAGGSGKECELVKKNTELKWSKWVQGAVVLRASTFPKVALQVFGAKDLKNADGHPGALNDVYCVVIWCGKEIGRTSVAPNTLMPQWSHEIFALMQPDEVDAHSLKIEAWDKDPTGDDEFLGEIIVEASRFPSGKIGKTFMPLEKSATRDARKQLHVGGSLGLCWSDQEFTRAVMDQEYNPGKVEAKGEDEDLWVSKGTPQERSELLPDEWAYDFKCDSCLWVTMLYAEQFGCAFLDGAIEQRAIDSGATQEEIELNVDSEGRGIKWLQQESAGFVDMGRYKGSCVPLRQLTTEQVVTMIKWLRFERYSDNFVEKQVTGISLMRYGDAELDKQLGINFRPHRLRLMQYLKDFEQKGVPGRLLGVQMGAETVFDLLNLPMQQLLLALNIIPGQFDLEAAATIAGGVSLRNTWKRSIVLMASLMFWKWKRMAKTGLGRWRRKNERMHEKRNLRLEQEKMRIELEETKRAREEKEAELKAEADALGGEAAAAAHKGHGFGHLLGGAKKHAEEKGHKPETEDDEAKAEGKGEGKEEDDDEHPESKGGIGQRLYEGLRSRFGRSQPKTPPPPPEVHKEDSDEEEEERDRRKEKKKNKEKKKKEKKQTKEDLEAMLKAEQAAKEAEENQQSGELTVLMREEEAAAWRIKCIDEARKRMDSEREEKEKVAVENEKKKRAEAEKTRRKLEETIARKKREKARAKKKNKKKKVKKKKKKVCKRRRAGSMCSAHTRYYLCRVTATATRTRRKATKKGRRAKETRAMEASSRMRIWTMKE
jgi:hypothetical protein